MPSRQTAADARSGRPVRIHARSILILVCTLAGVAHSQPAAAIADDREWDVVIYGGTSGGIAAAVQVKRMGGDAVVIEPSGRIGGLTTGGLGQTDIGNKSAIGGVSREFYQRIRQYYEAPERWKWQRREDYRGRGQSATGSNEDTMWTFEPSAALSVIEELVQEYEIPVVLDERLDRTAVANMAVLPLGVRKFGVAEGVQMRDGRIAAITMESGRTFRGKMFIDATYEGDLLAAASVTYTVGRESNAKYRETLNGVQTRNARHHQFLPGVDPNVEPGNPQRGLLPGIDPHGPGEEGSGDLRVQAYCFRVCLTDHPENRIPFAKPAEYDPLDFELLLRNFEAGERGMPWINSGMPNRKTDTNNRTGFSTDFIGQNYDYPEASYERRAEIVHRHRVYQQGLLWTLANHPRVPDPIRNEVARWGTCRDEFEREDGWQEQLYVREARRMIGEVVMTQHHCQGRTIADQPVGLAAYTMDSHNVQRYVDANGHARNEGDVQVGGFSPYPIDYRALVPKSEECENLLVPVCLSASHIAFGSIRMEPVFMVLGQSSATAAMQAIEDGVPVQRVDYAKLRERLLADQQVLEWTGPVRRPAEALDPKSLPGIVQDEEQAERAGFEGFSQLIGPFVGEGYRHDGNENKGDQSAKFRIKIPQAGRYEVRIAWTPNPNRATNVPVTVSHEGGSTTVRVNQREKPPHGAFGSVGTFTFAEGETTIEISNAGTNGHVIVDAVQLVSPANGTNPDQ